MGVRARAGGTAVARFGRSLALPTLPAASCFQCCVTSLSVLVSFARCDGGRSRGTGGSTGSPKDAWATVGLEVGSVMSFSRTGRKQLCPAVLCETSAGWPGAGEVY